MLQAASSAVAEDVGMSASPEVDYDYNLFALDLVVDSEGGLACCGPADTGLPGALVYDLTRGSRTEAHDFRASGDEDAVVGGVIVAGGAFRKASRHRCCRKRRWDGGPPVVNGGG